ncbi:MAG: hypothetical protein ACW96U_08180 [Candidatus Heimdallarchaeaceae archaeon]|jgi:hypothetical protein
MMDKIYSKYKEILYFGFSLVIISLGLGIWRFFNQMYITSDNLVEIALRRFLEIIPLLGLGFLKLGIGFAIVTIVRNISATGENATKSFNKAGLELKKPKMPFFSKAFPWFLISGIISELVAAIVMIFWINAGIKGDAFADHIYEIITVPIEALGVALLIGGIAFGLATIVMNLGIQVNELPRRLKILVKGEKNPEILDRSKLVPKWTIILTLTGMIVTASSFIPIAIVRAIHYSVTGLTPASLNGLFWDTWIFVGIAILLFSISYWLLRIIKWLRNQRSHIGETVGELAEIETRPLEQPLKITTAVHSFATAGLTWMFIFFFVITIYNAFNPSPLQMLIKPGRAISLALLFIGIGLALLTIVVNLKLTAFMLPGSFTNIVNVIKGDKKREEPPIAPEKPIKLSPLKLFFGLIFGVFLVILGTLPLAVLRISYKLQGMENQQWITEHLIGPVVTTGIATIFLMIGLFFSTIVGFVKARKSIISEGVESCVYYTLEKNS